MSKTILYNFEVERRFTRIYRKYQNAPRPLREANCLEQMYPDILREIEPGDRFAGRICMSLIGFSPEPGGLGYYCDADAITRMLKENDYTEAFQAEIKELLDFWKTETTSAKTREAYPAEVARALPSDRWMEEPLAAAPLYRMAGSYLDYEKLLKLGIPGLCRMVSERKKEAERRKEDTALFEGMEKALDVLKGCVLYYQKMAAELAGRAETAREAENLLMMAETLRKIAVQEPGTLREAMQLMWLYILISGTYNYGRMDVLLGDFLAEDLKHERITLQQAQELFNGLWKLIADRKTIWNGRVILGGRGRRNEEHADRVAMLALEASRIVEEVEPQLSLRLYDGMNEKLFEKALQVIGQGRTYPILYNDDVNIPSVSSAFRISEKEAENYVPFGCGEYVIDHKSYGSPNGIINLLKILELTLHNGRDAITGKMTGIPTGDFADFHTFEELWEAYQKQVQYFVDALAVQEEIEYRIAGETAPFLFLSMLYDDCVERGKGMFDGGVRYLGGTLETYGNINTADSLTAIKEMIYDKKQMTPEQLLEALAADFVGYAKEQAMLKSAPKYGNDSGEADDMAVKVHEHICRTVRDQVKKGNLHSYLVVMINNSANTTLGRLTAASADGRKKGMYMANGNNPWGGNDKKGLTAMLNSLVKLRTDLHAGAVQNMKFSPELFQDNGAIVKSLLKSYFHQGGAQAMISVVSKNDLEQALLYPERYQNLFVRVGGFSARFVELEKDVQMEIISRTLY